MSIAPTLEAERAAPCPFCGGTATPMHADDCYFVMQQKLRDAPKGDLSLVPEVLAAWNRRTATPAPADVALPLDAEGLTPLPQPAHRGPDGTGSYFDSYTAEQVRQAQREAVEAYARRLDPVIEKLRANVEATHQEAQALQTRHSALSPKQSISDDPKFHELMDEYDNAASHSAILHSLNALIAYIDGRTGGTTGDASNG